MHLRNWPSAMRVARSRETPKTLMNCLHDGRSATITPMAATLLEAMRGRSWHTPPSADAERTRNFVHALPPGHA